MEIVAKQTNVKQKGKLSQKLKNFFGAMIGSRGRKVMLLTGLLALLVVTGYLNFSLNQNAVDVNAGNMAETNMFFTLKENRADSRLARQLLLDDIIANTGSSAEAKATAEAELELLASEIAFETNAEGLIAAQCGFSDVIVSKNGTKLNVMIKTDEDVPSESVQKIMKILATAMGKDRLEPENGDALFISTL